MSAKIIDGKIRSAEIRKNLAVKTAKLFKERGIKPCLAVILVGHDNASTIYVRNKVKACGEVGFLSIQKSFPKDVSQAELLDTIVKLNQDDSVDGVLIQLPLPHHIDDQTVIESIDPRKDVDGFHLVNVGALMTGHPRLISCTPKGVIELATNHGTRSLKGWHAVIVGRSNIVGKPLAMLLLAEHCTVSICHSKTRDLASMTTKADLLIAAAGQPDLITKGMVKPGAIVIDVGINRDEQGTLCGDVDFNSVREVAGEITPVPGGVGPMTIAMLLSNTFQIAERRKNESS